MSEPIRVDAGCGASCIPGWIGVDLDPQFGMAQAPADALPWGDGEVDELHSSHLLEHTPDAAATLREWHRVLREGGLLTVRVPNLPAWIEHWQMTEGPERWEYPLTEWVFCWSSEGLTRHRTGFDVVRLREMVEAAGFAVESCEAVRSRAARGPEYMEQGDLLCKAVKREPEPV